MKENTQQQYLDKDCCPNPFGTCVPLPLYFLAKTQGQRWLLNVSITGNENAVLVTIFAPARRDRGDVALCATEGFEV